MGRLRDIYTKVESWMALGHFRAAELEFHKLPARALNTKRGLGIWMRLSRGLERWAEVEEAASQLRVLQPRETQPVLMEAEALHQQGRTKQAVFLLVTHAARFQGAAQSAYMATLRSYTVHNRQAVMSVAPAGVSNHQEQRAIFSWDADDDSSK